MERHRETFSTCALLLTGLLASCALDQTGQQIGQSGEGSDDSAAAADDAARRDEHIAIGITEEGPVRGVATETGHHQASEFGLSGLYIH